MNWRTGSLHGAVVEEIVDDLQAAGIRVLKCHAGAAAGQVGFSSDTTLNALRSAVRGSDGPVATTGDGRHFDLHT